MGCRRARSVRGPLNLGRLRRPPRRRGVKTCPRGCRPALHKKVCAVYANINTEKLSGTATGINMYQHTSSVIINVSEVPPSADKKERAMMSTGISHFSGRYGGSSANKPAPDSATKL